jgi:hypothetical protein
LRDVSPAVRLFVRGFLAAFLVAGLAGVEAWPFTGFRLFSHVRSEQVRGWQATTVDRSGVESPVRSSTMPIAYRGLQHVADGFAGLDGAGRLAVCRAWAGSAADVVEVRLYTTTERLTEPGSWRRELRHTCDLSR